ncbi:hypothetical protein ACXYN8_04150 [Altererythrobacter sp. CAU 1778]
MGLIDTLVDLCVDHAATIDHLTGRKDANGRKYHYERNVRPSGRRIAGIVFGVLTAGLAFGMVVFAGRSIDSLEDRQPEVRTEKRCGANPWAVDCP